MCGIAGKMTFDGRPVAHGEIQAMTDAMVHRGPNDEGFYRAPGVGLGMRRLSIIDLAGGRQPISNEDGTVWVVLNGEIYNYRELRRELEGRGHLFATESDTEVIVHLYEERGPDCVKALRGMFGFAVWDVKGKRLCLARDRIGIKPLYVSQDHDGLLFASELKSILTVRRTPMALDWTAVHHLFTFGTTPPEQSIVAGVRKLPPGHVLVARADGAVSTHRYWEVEFVPDHARSEAQWIEDLRDTLQESVGLHMLSDVPLGAFLSGGVDSSAVVAAMTRASSAAPRTFSIGFHEADFDELDGARMTADFLGTRHREAVLEPQVVDVLGKVAWYLDEPFGDSSAIPTYMVSQMAASDVTVVLSGDGGDELFAGYDRYQVEMRERRNRFIPAPVRSLLGSIGESLPEGTTGRELLRHLRLTGAARYLDSGTIFKADQKGKLFAPDVRALFSPSDPHGPAARYLDVPGCHWLSALQRFDLETYLPLDILTKVDRMSMAHSIEARVPLLDHKVIELAARIPPELLLRRGSGKYIFKRALEGWVPPAILDRPKRGFAIPLGHWFRGQLSDFVTDLLLSPESRARGIFQPAYVSDLIRMHQAGRPLDLQLFTLMSFELWCRTFMDAPRDALGARPVRPAATAPSVTPAGPRAASVALHDGRPLP